MKVASLVSALAAGAIACGELAPERGASLRDAGTDSSSDSSRSCPSGKSLCAGVCVDERADPNHCGACETACASSQSCAGGRCVATTSCATGGLGLTDCGANKESCCTSLVVEDGTYFRTYDPVVSDGGLPYVAVAAGGGPTGEAHPAKLSAFRLDKYLVTVGRFRQFVSAWNGGAGYLPPSGSGKHTHLNGGMGLTNSSSPGAYETGWVTADDKNIDPANANLACSPEDKPAAPATWTATPAANEDLPMNCVNWFESYAFCIWDGGFLPSEAEWEYAAAGGSEQREYPWGSSDPGTGYLYANHDNGYFDSVGSYFAPVGAATRGAGRWSQFDLAGEVNEWTMDFFAYYSDPCIDCASLTPTSAGPELAPLGRVARGGFFGVGATELVPSARNFSSDPTGRAFDFGFRCARAP